MEKDVEQIVITKKDKRIKYLLVSLSIFYAIIVLLMTFDQHITTTEAFIGIIVLAFVGIPVFLLDMYVIDSQNERLKQIATLPCFLFSLHLYFLY